MMLRSIIIGPQHTTHTNKIMTEIVFTDLKPVDVHVFKNKHTITVVRGVDECFDLKKLLKEWKLLCHTNGYIRGGEIHLQGDHGQFVATFLKEVSICLGEQIRLHEI